MQHAEQALIAAVMRKPSMLSTVNLSPSDFSNPTLAGIWDAIEAIAPVKPVDLITVTDYLDQTTGQDWLKSVSFVANSPCTIESLPTYESEIKAQARERVTRDVLARYLDQRSTIDVAALTSELMALDTHHSKRKIMSMAEAVSASFDKIEQAIAKGDAPGHKTGIAILDEHLGGMHDSDLYVFGGRPAMGKTAFLISIMLASPTKGFFVSGEMAIDQVGQRMISQQSKVAATKLRNGKIDESEWPMITAAMQSLLAKKVWTYDSPNPSIKEVMQKARIARHEYGVEVIYCDYLQKFTDIDAKHEREEIARSVISLKNLARELQCPVVTLAQLNRNCESRPDKRPIMSDLGGSGAIEQEPDAIGFLYRDVVYNENANPNEAELIWGKNRHGPTGYMPLHFEPKTMIFRDVI